jgi:hypothetical protein
MTIPYAARFATIAFLAASLFTAWQLQPGLAPFVLPLTGYPDLTDELQARQSWYVAHRVPWQAGWWLWLLAIFSWMVLLVVLAWSYLPAHRVTGMLQSGLMLIAAVLAIAGVNVWMVLLPAALTPAEPDSHLVALTDLLARTLLGSGALMGGITTAWIAVELLQRRLLPRLWLALLGASGLCTLLAPFFALNVLLLLLALGCWLLACAWLAMHPRLPSLFPTWQH